jgi:hypothetical protein
MLINAGIEDPKFKAKYRWLEEKMLDCNSKN